MGRGPESPLVKNHYFRVSEQKGEKVAARTGALKDLKSNVISGGDKPRA